MRSSKLFLYTLIVFVTIWAAIVVFSGAGWNPLGIPWSFANSGAFGDSFGPLSAIMAGLAAFAAFEALSEQRLELRRLRDREKSEDLRREKLSRQQRQADRVKQRSERRMLFEGTFFNLLGYFRDIAKETDIGIGEHRKTSTDAFQRMCTNLVNSYSRSGKDLGVAWGSTIQLHKNDLNHYFRTLYHLISYAEDEKEVDSYFYVRLVRALLSEAELVLLFANCAVGEGKEKFRPLVIKYALLHNVSQDSRIKWEMDKYFTDGAFGVQSKN